MKFTLVLAALALVQSTKLEQKSTQDGDAYVAMMDKDGDNLADFEEAVAVLGSISRKDFDAVDTDNDGKLSGAEITASQ